MAGAGPSYGNVLAGIVGQQRNSYPLESLPQCLGRPLEELGFPPDIRI